MELAHRIREARLTRLSMTQSELARHLGVEAVTISRWERGAVEPRPRVLRELATLAEVPVAWFFTSDEEAVA